MKKGSSSQVSDSLQAPSHLALEGIQSKGKTGRMCLGRHPEANRLVPAASPRHGREAKLRNKCTSEDQTRVCLASRLLFLPFHSFVFKEILGIIKKKYRSFLT